MAKRPGDAGPFGNLKPASGLAAAAGGEGERA
jgi:hypothetical protein